MSDVKHKKVFISYSHDSQEHKDKVRNLADNLCTDYGIDVIGDFYDEYNPAGGQLPDLMEKIRMCDKVICILTPLYKLKADEGKGGVGYEKTIITDQLFHDIGSDKFIPVSLYSDIGYKDCVPNFLTTTRKALLRTTFETDDLLFEEIARSVWSMPKNPKPPIGKNSLLTERKVIEVEKIDVESISVISNHKDIYNAALFYAKGNDEINFRILLKKVKRQVFLELNELKESYEKNPSSLQDDLHNAMDKFVNIASPLFLIAFAGFLSFNDRFHHQEGLLIDLLTIEGWGDKGGRVILLNVPQLLAYVYHHVYGALNIDNECIGNLAKICDQKIPSNEEGKYEKLYKVHAVTGWIYSLGKDCFQSFKYLLDAYQRWSWLKLLFDDENTFQKSLVCYQTTLNLLNYFNCVKNNSLLTQDQHRPSCDVPPSSIIADRKMKEYTHHYLIKYSDFFKNYLTQHAISQQEVADQWDVWLRDICSFNTHRNFDFWMYRDDFIADLLK